MQPCDREGRWKGIVNSAAVKQFPSGAVGVALVVSCDQIQSGNGWADWSEYQMEAEGTLFFVKSDGEPNDNAVSALRDTFAWDGDIRKLNAGLIGRPLQFTTQLDAYKGRERYRIGFINHVDSSGAVSQAADDATLTVLQNQYGPKLAQVAKSKPMPPRPKASPAKPAPAAPAASPPAEQEEVPF